MTPGAGRHQRADPTVVAAHVDPHVGADPQPALVVQGERSQSLARQAVGGGERHRPQAVVTHQPARPGEPDEPVARLEDGVDLGARQTVVAAEVLDVDASSDGAGGEGQGQGQEG